MFNFPKSLEAGRSPKNAGNTKTLSQKQQISKISSYQTENSPYQIDLIKRVEKSSRGDQNPNLVEIQNPQNKPDFQKEVILTSYGTSNKNSYKENAPIKQRPGKKEQISLTMGMEHPFQVPNLCFKAPLSNQIESISIPPGRDHGNSVSRNLGNSIQQERPNFQGIKMKTLAENKSVDSFNSQFMQNQNSSHQYDNNCSYEDDLRNSGIYTIKNSSKQSYINTSQHYLPSQYGENAHQKTSVLSNSCDQTTIKSSGTREEVVKSLNEKINVLNTEIKKLEELNLILNSDVSHWSKAFESMRKKYADLVEQSSRLQKELENLKLTSKTNYTRNDLKFQNPTILIKAQQQYQQQIQINKNQQQRSQIQRENEEKIKSLEAEKKDWKAKCEKLEKDHLQEIDQLKAVMEPESEYEEGTAAKEISNPNEKKVEQVKSQLQALLCENEKLNLITSQLFEEIRLKKEKNPALVERDAFIKGLIIKLANDRDEIESANQEEIIKLTKEIDQISKINEEWRKEMEEREQLLLEYYEDNEDNYVSSLTEEKRMDFLSLENRKLEEQIDNWKKQFQSLEKKVEHNRALRNDLKYTEEEVNSILNKLTEEHEKGEEELRLKLEKLEQDIGETKKIKAQKKPQSKLKTQSARDTYSAHISKKKQNENANFGNALLMNHKSKKL